MTIRVHELAKDMKMTSKEIIDKLKSLKIEAKSHMSVLTAEDVTALKGSLKKSTAPAKTAKVSKPVEKKEAAPAVVPPPPPKAAPVQTPSIESAKRELLLQRTVANKANEVKKSQAAPSTFVSQPFKRPAFQTPAPARPKAAEPRKIFKSPSSSFAEPGKFPPGILTPPTPEPVRIRKMELQTPITVKDLAEKMGVRASEAIQKLIKLNIFASINQSVNFEVAAKVAIEFGFELTKKEMPVENAVVAKQETKDKTQLVSRAPVVTFMGHVDHGKTSLLDAIRKTKVAASEAGGITQHIGAYEVFLPKGAITFLDTPGHEAFTQMRARGARVTDVVVLVVAADDGVMPQTIEAIDHAKAAGVPILVAINKIDLPSANLDRVKKGLMEHGLTSEDWGGKTIMAGVSAKTGQGIDELLEMLVLESELLELKANPSALASGIVIEAELSKESGVLATVMVQDGTLRVGDVVIAGNQFSKVRAMINDRGQRIKEALPSTPVEILGLSVVPKAGEHFYVVKDERAAKEVMEKRHASGQDKKEAGPHITLEHLLEDIKAGKAEELKLIIKSDVQGSVEALRNTLGTIKSKNVRLNTIHSGIGDISESDVLLAAASNAVVIGFHVGIVGTAREAAEKEEVDVRFYEIIYEVKTAIEKAMEGLLMPEEKEVFVGVAEVRQVFKVSKVGSIAGCSVQKGKIVRNFQCRVLRAGQKIHEGKVISLKRFKDDAREVLEGFECGIGVSNFDELQAGDRIEVFEIQKKARKLE